MKPGSGKGWKNTKKPKLSHLQKVTAEKSRSGNGVCVSVHVYMCAYTCVHICVFMSVSVYVCLYVCACV